MNSGGWPGLKRCEAPQQPALADETRTEPSREHGMACTTGQTPDRSAAPPRPDWLRPLGRTSVALLLTAALVLCFKPGWRRADSPLSVPNAVANAVAAQTLPTKSIQDIRVGDRVVARDTETGRSEAKRVARVFRRTSDHLRLLTVRSPRNGTIQQLKTTDEHPFWTADQCWADAGDLAVGDRLLQQDGGPAVVVSTDHEPHPEGVPVYNLETEDHHTYHVSAHGSRAPPLLVHNCSLPPRQFIPSSEIEATAARLRAPSAPIRRTGPVGVDPLHHNANVLVRDAQGNIIGHTRIVSGNMTHAEQALGFPKNTLASHTEARAVTQTPLGQGQSMTITGQRPPCPPCKGAMNRATTESGATIRYRWRENGQTQYWPAGGN